MSEVPGKTSLSSSSSRQNNKTTKKDSSKFVPLETDSGNKSNRKTSPSSRRPIKKRVLRNSFVSSSSSAKHVLKKPIHRRSVVNVKTKGKDTLAVPQPIRLRRQVASAWLYKKALVSSRSGGFVFDWLAILGQEPPSTGSYYYDEHYPKSSKDKNKTPTSTATTSSRRRLSLLSNTSSNEEELEEDKDANFDSSTATTVAKQGAPQDSRSGTNKPEDFDPVELEVQTLTTKVHGIKQTNQDDQGKINSVTPSPYPPEEVAENADMGMQRCESNDQDDTKAMPPPPPKSISRRRVVTFEDSNDPVKKIKKVKTENKHGRGQVALKKVIDVERRSQVLVPQQQKGAKKEVRMKSKTPDNTMKDSPSNSVPRPATFVPVKFSHPIMTGPKSAPTGLTTGSKTGFAPPTWSSGFAPISSLVPSKLPYGTSTAAHGTPPQAQAYSQNPWQQDGYSTSYRSEPYPQMQKAIIPPSGAIPSQRFFSPLVSKRSSAFVQPSGMGASPPRDDRKPPARP